MKINITKKQYEVIIKCLEMGSFIYGPLSDFSDKKYKVDSREIEAVKQELLSYSKDYDFDKNLIKFDNDIMLNDEYLAKILDDLEDYDDMQLYENLSRELGKRDFRTKYSEEEIEKILDDNNGYLGVVLYDFEDKYFKEFDEHGFDRLFIKE